jgi:hypothetical protein
MTRAFEQMQVLALGGIETQVEPGRGPLARGVRIEAEDVPARHGAREAAARVPGAQLDRPSPAGGGQQHAEPRRYADGRRRLTAHGSAVAE